MEGLEPVGWREVPHDVAALGSTATASMPRIAQLVLAPCPSPDAELRAHRARRRAESVSGVYVASLSFRTVTYKALCAATQLAAFYPDLADPELGGRLGDLPPALLDQHRAELGAGAAVPAALPQRRDQHDRGERRLDGGPRAGARRRRKGLHRRSIASGSDSAILDNALELLVRSGLDVREAMTMLVPPAWQNDPRTTRRGAARCTATTRCWSSPGTGRRGSCSRTGSRAVPRSTATGCGRCGSPSATTASSPSARRPVRSRSPTAPPSAAPASARVRSSRSTPSEGCCSTAS